MLRKIGLLLFLCFLVVALRAPQVSAFPVAGQEWDYTALFFRSSEMLVDNGGDVVTLPLVDPEGIPIVDPAGDPVATYSVPTIDVGDQFWGVFKLNEIVPTNDPTGQTGGTEIDFPGEVTGYFATEVAAIIPAAGPGGVDEIILTKTTDPNGILAAGEVLQLYEGASNFNDTTQLSAITTATDGTFHSSWGFDQSTSLAEYVVDPNADNDDGYWWSEAPVVPPGAEDIGESYGGLYGIDTPFYGFEAVNDPSEGKFDDWVDMFFNVELVNLYQYHNIGGTDYLVPNLWYYGAFDIGNGHTNPVPGGSWAEPMNFGDNDPAIFSTIIPEPATMLLLGSGLIGLAGIGRKKLFGKGK